jgi:hypothetical protein
MAYTTLFVPVEGYVKQLEQLIAIQYRVGTPQEAEPLQHELQRVVEYNHKTHSGYYPVYLGDDNAEPQTN